MNNLGTQILQSERLELKKITLDNAQDLYELLSDEKVQVFLAGIPPYTGVEMAIDYIGNVLEKKYMEDDFYDWGIFEKGKDKLIGRITVYKQDQYRRMADLVWYMRKDCRGKGYMTEAAKMVVKFLQEIGFERIEAFANVENIASQTVMEKAGFQFEGVLRKYDLRRDGSLYDAKMYSIIK